VSETDQTDETARLRAAMQALREDDAKRTPDFRAMVDAPARTPRVVRFGRLAPAVASLAVAAAVIGLFVRGERAAQAPASVAFAPPAAATAARARTRAPRREDVAPLDFLLDAPLHALVAVGSRPATTDFLAKEPVR
jgi:hypothetical protein